jgi:hypothetical protein
VWRVHAERQIEWFVGEHGDRWCRLPRASGLPDGDEIPAVGSEVEVYYSYSYSLK